jgi:hypothetical protein
MEELKNYETIKVPNWHKTILQEREEMIKNGKAEYIDLESVKISIAKEICNQKKLNNR